MARQAFFATTVILLALALYLLQECQFLIPYRKILVAWYGAVIAGFSALLFVNLFAAIYLGMRKLLLKDTGRKLAHLEKEVRAGSYISEELSQRLSE